MNSFSDTFKKWVAKLSLILCLTAAISLPAAAADISMLVDGVPLVADVAPVNVDNRVLVPVRPLFEAFGAELYWNESTRTAMATTLETRVVLQIDSKTAEVNGSEVTLDVPAQLISNRTYVPVRFVAEAFGATVDWDASLQQVIVTGGPLSQQVLTASTPLMLAQPAENEYTTQLNAAINSLTSPYVQEIDDVTLDPEMAFNIYDYPGVQSWSCRWVKTKDKLTLTWTFEWADDHAIIAAYKNPALENKLTAKQKAVLQKCRSIISTEIKPGMSAYQKQLAIHDYIVLNCQYDTATAASRDSSNKDPFSAYGALINGLAVCQGYAEAAQVLLTMTGIECYRLNSDDHSWNLVKIEGGYYHMDVTWDDPTPDTPGKVRYDYFNLTDAQMLKYASHDWLDKAKYPAANATKYNYFVYNNLVANDLAEVEQKLTEAFRSGADEVTIWVGDYRAGAYDWNTDLGFLFDLMKGSGRKSFSYSAPGSDRDTLTVMFNE